MWACPQANKCIPVTSAVVLVVSPLHGVHQCSGSVQTPDLSRLQPTSQTTTPCIIPSSVLDIHDSCHIVQPQTSIHSFVDPSHNPSIHPFHHPSKEPALSIRPLSSFPCQIQAKNNLLWGCCKGFELPLLASKYSG